MSRFSLWSISLLMLCAQAYGHQLPDDEIERSVQVSVKPDCVLVEYSLAMNESTLKSELENHGLEPAAAFSEMWKQYQKIILRSLAKRIRLTVDGELARLEPIQANYTGWSHRHLTCLLKSEVRFSARRRRIVVTDGNFRDAPGNYRIAMKGRSGAIVENATVPLLVSRAKSVKLADLPKLERESKARAEGDVVVKEVR